MKDVVTRNHIKQKPPKYLMHSTLHYMSSVFFYSLWYKLNNGSCGVNDFGACYLEASCL